MGDVHGSVRESAAKLKWNASCTNIPKHFNRKRIWIFSSKKTKKSHDDNSVAKQAQTLLYFQEIRCFSSVTHSPSTQRRRPSFKRQRIERKWENRRKHENVFMTSDEWEILSFLYNFFTFGILHRSCRIFFIALKYVRIFFEYIFSIYFIVCNDFFLFNLLHGYSYILSFNGIFSSWMLPHCLSLHGQNSHQ